MEKQPISREGYDKLREEIRRLEDEEMPKIAAQIAAARAEGDLSENAEYHGQRERRACCRRRSTSSKASWATATSPIRRDAERGRGFRRDRDHQGPSDGSLEKYELVGPGEENYDGEVMKILTSSPIAQGC